MSESGGAWSTSKRVSIDEIVAESSGVLLVVNIAGDDCKPAVDTSSVPLLPGGCC